MVKLTHVGIPARDLAGLTTFYTEYLGLKRVAQVHTEETGDMVLLSGRPDERPQELSLLTNPEAGHIAFEVETLAELRDLHTGATGHGARVLFGFDHGSELSLYVLDPEGNAIEVSWPTGRRPNGTNRPIDLNRPEADLLLELGE
jgi:catechol-2,3-dioxygenase